MLCIDESMSAYDIPRSKNMLKQFVSPRSLSVSDIMNRIFRNRERFETRFETKKKKNEEYYKEKAFIPEI